VAKKEPDSGGIKIITENRKARFEYEIIEKFEAGIILTGSEIKSIRQDGASIAESYVRPDNDTVYLLGAHIKPYAFSSEKDYNPTRARKLLLHRHQIEKLRGRVEEKGLTIVPLKLYFKGGYAKLEIALARGKAAPDKRHTIKAREGEREIARVMKRGR
jgi:SsrA-binding protein